MMTIKQWLALGLAFIFLITGCHKKEVNLIQFVDPLNGSINRSKVVDFKESEKFKSAGHLPPFVSTPFAMTHWTAQTNDTEQIGVAPYQYRDHKIQGFRASHWSGSLESKDYGSFTIMPITGYLRTFATERASSFLHESETSTPSYYSCILDNYTTLVEMTAKSRAAFFRFSYLKQDQAFILVTPNSDAGEGFIKVDPDRQEIYGYNPVYYNVNKASTLSGLKGYFLIRFNRPFNIYGCYYQMEDHKMQTEISGKPDIGAYAGFELGANDVILAKAGTSFTSIKAARANLDAEIGHWNFETTQSQTEQLWNSALSAIEIKGGKLENYSKFYTALYHTMLLPRTLSDTDGCYPDFSGNPVNRYMKEGHTHYGDFLQTDDNKIHLALLSLIAPLQYKDMIKSLGSTANPKQYVLKKVVVDRLDSQTTKAENNTSVINSTLYVFSSIGLNPINNEGIEYHLSLPCFQKVKLNLNPKYFPGDSFKILSDTSKSVNRVKLNGKDHPFFLKHEEIVLEGQLEFIH